LIKEKGKEFNITPHPNPLSQGEKRIRGREIIQGLPPH
jgi:hypothetical protein